MPFKERCGLLKFGEHPRCVGSVLLRLPLEGFDLGRLQRQAPVKVDPAEAAVLSRKRETVVDEDW